jgi:predicted TIM-barrel fold metal-dependent hydrolase
VQGEGSKPPCTSSAFGGVFDRYPNLRIVISHVAEVLPFLF